MKRRMNKLDYAIIAFIVILIGLFVYKNSASIYDRYKGESSVLELEDREFTYVIEEVRMFSIDVLHVGDALYDNDSGAYLGEITDVSYEPYREGILRNDGTFVMAPVPEKYTAYITVKGHILETDEKYLAEGSFELKMNSRIVLGTKWIKVEGELAYFIDDGIHYYEY